MVFQQILTPISDFIIILIALYATRQIVINRKQLHLSTINYCISNFRSLKGLDQNCTDKIVLSQYLDLVNEELFYFQHKYLPNEISNEWIDGMIDFLPITNSKSEVLNENFCIKYLSDYREEMFKNYPRIKHAFELESHHNYDVALLYNNSKEFRKARIVERKVLIAEVLANIKSFDGFS